MPKIVKPLVDSKITSAKPKENDYYLPDGNGLRLLIKANKTKIWEFTYSSPIFKETRRILIKEKNEHGKLINVLDEKGNKTYRETISPKRRKFYIGKYPSLTLGQARKKRDEYNELIANDIDPKEFINEKKQESILSEKGNFTNVFEEWFEIEKNHLEEVTYKKKYNLMKNSLITSLGEKHIKDIKKEELLDILKEKEKTAPETASRLYTYIMQLWDYAIEIGYTKELLLTKNGKKYALKRKIEKKHYEKITDKTIFKELVNELYSNNRCTPSIKNALKLVLHIPLRAFNLCNLKWEYIDFENKILTIPRNLMKVKDAELPDFKLPLTDEVLKILQEQKDSTTIYTDIKEYIFIGTDNKNPINSESPNQALTRLGFSNKKKQSLHSFRGSFRTLAEEHAIEHNCEHKIMESILDHYKLSRVEKAYLHKVSYIEEQRKLLNWWSDFVLKCISGQ